MLYFVKFKAHKKEKKGHKQEGCKQDLQCLWHLGTAFTKPSDHCGKLTKKKKPAVTSEEAFKRLQINTESYLQFSQFV